MRTHFITWIVKALYISISGRSVFPLSPTAGALQWPIQLHLCPYTECTGLRMRVRQELLLAIVSSTACVVVTKFGHTAVSQYTHLKAAAPYTYTPTHHAVYAGLHT